VRTLPLRLSPIAGESLPGYIARYAHRFQFPPGDVIRALRLDQGAGTVAAAGRYSVALTDQQLRDAGFATGIATETLESMLLSRYAGLAFDRSAFAAPIALLSIAHVHEVLIWGSRFCPECLRKDGAWRLSWQLSWSTVCVCHQLVLARRCPSCGGVPELGPCGRWREDQRGLLTDPTCCMHRTDGQLCREPLTLTTAISAADPRVLSAQRRIDAVLDGLKRPTLAGVEMQPPVFLRDLLTLCNLVDRHAQPPTPRPSGARGRRLHDHPEALATVLSDALALADLPVPDALAEALREFADRRYRADGLTLLASTNGPASDHLAGILRRALSQTVWASASRQLGIHPIAHRRPDDLDPRLQPRHVPQLFWIEDYEHELHTLFDFDDFTHWLGRRFCSVLLIRMLAPLDWLGAVRCLDFPEQPRFINAGYNTTFGKLRTHRRFDELARRIKRIANRHAEVELIDYTQLRADLADWDGIEINCWHLLEPRPRPVHPWQRVDKPLRRRQASIWLWCHLTSGHERAAPLPLPTRRGLSEQTQFIRDVLPTLRERLLILEQLLVTTPAGARSTLHNRLAAALHHRRYLAANFHLDTIDPSIIARVLAYVAAHTGVDIPSVTTPSVGSHAPPAVTHARLLATRLLRHIALPSYMAIGAAIGGDGNHLADNDRHYRHALDHDPHLAAKMDQLATAIERWQDPAPAPPTAPHHQRMRGIALAIKHNCEQLLGPSHGHYLAGCTSISLCRDHTDLTCYEIADIHAVKDAQPSFSHATVARHRRCDNAFLQRHRQLLDQAHELQRAAGYTNANLKRGLTTAPPTVPNKRSHSKLA
jgi:TniQ